MRSLAFFMFFPIWLEAQLHDRIFHVISQLTNDTEKVNRFYSRGFGLRNQDPALAMAYAEACELAAHRSGSELHVAKSQNLSGILYYKAGNYREAVNRHEAALEIRRRHGDEAGAALSLVNLGNIYLDMHFPDKAKANYEAAREIFEQNKDVKQLGNSYVNLGVANHELKNYRAAVENYDLAIAIAEKTNNYELRSLCLNNMAQIYFERGDYQKSVALNHDALKIREMMDNEVEAADSHLNLALNYMKLKDYPETKAHLDEAYARAKKFNAAEVLQLSHKTYAEFFSATGDYRSAYSWLCLYQQKQDSISQLVAGPGPVVLPVIYRDSKNSGINNLWLLISVFALILFTPLRLVRYKR